MHKILSRLTLYVRQLPFPLTVIHIIYELKQQYVTFKMTNEGSKT
jgi:hypothetical protein